jgi:hypothetical protein
MAKQLAIHEHLKSGDAQDYILDCELLAWSKLHAVPNAALVQVERYLLSKLNASRVALEYKHGGKTKGWRGVYFAQCAVSTTGILNYNYMELLNEKSCD